MKIEIIQKQLAGTPDFYHSIEVPKEGKLKEEPYIPSGEPRINLDVHWPVPTVSVGHFNMLWIAERKEWVGLEYTPGGSHFESCWAGVEEDSPSIHGPYRLDQRCASLIRNAYGNTRLPLEKVLTSTPDELMQR